MQLLAAVESCFITEQEGRLSITAHFSFFWGRGCTYTLLLSCTCVPPPPCTDVLSHTHTHIYIKISISYTVKIVPPKIEPVGKVEERERDREIEIERECHQNYS
jgi:hypothetical protein